MENTWRSQGTLFLNFINLGIWGSIGCVSLLLGLRSVAVSLSGGWFLCVWHCRSSDHCWLSMASVCQGCGLFPCVIIYMWQAHRLKIMHRVFEWGHSFCVHLLVLRSQHCQGEWLSILMSEWTPAPDRYSSWLSEIQEMSHSQWDGISVCDK